VKNLIELLLERGCNVQLRHIPTETSFQDRVDHGYIAVFVDGQQLLRRDGFQHNANLRRGGAYDMSACTEVVDETLEALEAKTAPSSTTKVEDEAAMQKIEGGLETLKVEAKAGAPAA